MRFLIGGIIAGGKVALRFGGRLLVPSKEMAVRGSQAAGTVLRTTAAVGVAGAADESLNEGKGRKAIAGGVSDTFDGLKKLPFGADVQQAVVNTAAAGYGVTTIPGKFAGDVVETNLKNNGHGELAKAVDASGKVGAFIPTLGFVAASGEGRKAKMLVGQMKSNDISEAEMVDYLAANPTVLSGLESRGFNKEELNEALPSLQATLEAQPTLEASEGLESVRDLAADFGGQAQNAAQDVAQGAAKLTGFAAIFSFIDKLIDEVASFFKGIINDIFSGNSVGQGNLKFANADVPDFERAPRGPAPELGLA